MRYLSVCSGIEAATVAWHPLGWAPVAFSEIEAFPSAALKHHYPDVPNLGDMTKYKDWPDYAVDLVVGGTPCQAFSVAGLRKGLADPRGNLTLTFLAIVARYSPRWLVWENVPGVLSDETGAFGSLLGGLAELGYGFAYRILDAQYYGVAQRRRRVFVVGHSGGRWQRAAAVLFERESLCWNSPPRREPGQRVAQPLANGSGERGWKISADNAATHLMPVGFTCKDHGADVGENIAPTLRAMGHTGSSPNGGGQVAIACFDERQVTSKTHRGQCSGDVTGTLNSGAGMTVAHSLRAEGHDASEDGTGRGTPLVPELARCVATREGMSLDWETTTILPAQMAVRRLTPRECERLQGFPDDYTKIPYRGKPSEQCPDGPRYKALGNSMAVPVMRWIAHSITQIDHL
jgi:DNA (cytosine-5)-methyltransferase 1